MNHIDVGIEDILAHMVLGPGLLCQVGNASMPHCILHHLCSMVMTRACALELLCVSQAVQMLVPLL